MNEIHCPKCNSTQLTANKKGFSTKKAIAGAVLTGGIGLLAGTIGSNKVKITCLSCGYIFKPGEGATRLITDTAISKKFLNGDISDFDNLLIATIKAQGYVEATKEVQKKKGISLNESKIYVDNLIKAHGITPAKPTGCAGIIVFSLIIGLIICLIKYIF